MTDGHVVQVMRRCNTVRALFPFPITQAPGDLLEAPLQQGLQHAKDQGMCPPGCRVVVMAENLADGPDTLPVLFTRVCPLAINTDVGMWLGVLPCSEAIRLRGLSCVL